MALNEFQEQLKATLRAYPDYPKPGIIFRDVGPLLADPELLSRATDAIVEAIRASGVDPDTIDAVAGMEARGFIFGVLVAQRIKKAFIMIRKPSKIPGEVFSIDYGLEYGRNTLQLQKGLVSPGQRVVVVDDLLATGGTAKAAFDLLQLAGAVVVSSAYLVELAGLPGRAALLEALPTASVASVLSI